MDDVPIEKIAISGVTLASLLHRFISAEGAIHGFLFGHLSAAAPATLSDDDPLPAADTTSSLLTATITSFLSLPAHLPLALPDPPSSAAVIGWFAGRRRSPLRPSLKDQVTTRDITSNNSLQLCVETLTLPPSIFLQLATPVLDQLIHTHEYKAYQYRIPTKSFEPRDLSIINIGPSFRSSYKSFSPNAMFPMVNLRNLNAMVVDDDGSSKESKDAQKELDKLAEDFDISRLRRLVDPESNPCATGLDDLYGKMLRRMEAMVKQVKLSSAKVREQESKNQKLRLEVAGLE